MVELGNAEQGTRNKELRNKDYGFGRGRYVQSAFVGTLKKYAQMDAAMNQSQTRARYDLGKRGARFSGLVIDVVEALPEQPEGASHCRAIIEIGNLASAESWRDAKLGVAERFHP